MAEAHAHSNPSERYYVPASSRWPIVASVALFVTGAVGVSRADAFGMPAPNGAVAMMIIGAVYWLFAWAPFAGLKIIKPNEALVLTLFGNYYGSLKSPGFFYVNPFCVGVNPAVREPGAPQDAAPAAAASSAAASGDTPAQTAAPTSDNLNAWLNSFYASESKRTESNRKIPWENPNQDY